MRSQLSYVSLSVLEKLTPTELSPGRLPAWNAQRSPGNLAAHLNRINPLPPMKLL